MSELTRNADNNEQEEAIYTIEKWLQRLNIKKFSYHVDSYYKKMEIDVNEKTISINKNGFVKSDDGNYGVYVNEINIPAKDSFQIFQEAMTKINEKKYFSLMKVPACFKNIVNQINYNIEDVLVMFEVDNFDENNIIGKPVLYQGDNEFILNTFFNIDKHSASNISVYEFEENFKNKEIPILDYFTCNNRCFYIFTPQYVG